MFKLTAFILLAALALAAEPRLDDGVYLLDGTNFEEFVLLNPETLVLVHGPNCSYCDQVRETFKRLQQKNADKYPDLKTAFLDGESDEKVKQGNDIEKTPQMRLYLNKGFFAFYEEDLSDEGLQEFLDRHLPVKAEPVLIDSDRSFVRFNNKQNTIALAFKSVGPEEKDFATGLQKVVPDIPVYYMKTNSKYGFMVFPEDSSKSHFKMKMKRDFDEGDKFLGTRDMFAPRHILKIVWPYRKHKIEAFTEKALRQTLRLKRAGVYFVDGDLDSDAFESFSKAVLSSSLDAVFVKSNLRELGAEKLLNIFGVDETDFPTVRIVDVKDNRLRKFKLEGEVTEYSVKEFLEKYEKNQLKDYKKSQKPFDNSGRQILRFSRETLLTQAQDASTHLVIAFVGKEAAKTEAVLEAAAQKLARRNAFTLGTVDVNRNDVDGFNKDKIPVIQILTKQQRKRPLSYDGEHTPDALAAFLNDSVEGSDEL